MNQPVVVVEGRERGSFADRWWGKAALLALSVLALTLALAPVGQFYLAWVGVVPWLWVVRQSRSAWRAFWWSWAAGTAFFLANMWWLMYVTLPGMVALMVYLGVYWGVGAMVLRGILRKTEAGKAAIKSVLLIAAVLAGLEWVRGNLFTGLPWLYLGHTQSPVLVLCQVADVVGVQGISFWVASINALIFLAIVVSERRRLLPAGAVVAGMTVLMLGYGVWRDRQTASVVTPGPVVAVVQSNYPQDNSGEKGASEKERIKFHVDATETAVRQSGERGIDLVCWSETMMPGLNDEFRRGMYGAKMVDRKTHEIIDENFGATLDAYFERLLALARDYRVNVLTGGLFETDLKDPDKFLFADRRNSAYLFLSDGRLAAERYDKIHLVPFGEFIPFKRSTYFHWIYSFFQMFSPYGDFDYTLTPGSEDAPTVFSMRNRGDGGAVRVVSPICFEDIDSGLCAKMFRGSGGKRADLLVNLTNDGWFKANENAQHLQAAIFRSIENRVPTARSVNTGISGFIDSYGRVSDKIAAGTAGTAVRQVMLDSRYTLFTRFGDWFAIVCTVVAAVIAAIGLREWWRARRLARQKGRG